MKTLASIALVFFISLSAVAQEDNNWISKEYSINNFSSIYLEGGYKVYLSQGDKASLTVKTTNENMFDVLEVSNRGDELSLVMNRDYLSYRRIRLYITVKDLDQVKAEGGLSLESEGYLDLKDIKLHVQGGAKVDLKMKAREVDVIGEGGVLVSLSGVANELSVILSGAGHVDADDLKAEDVHIEIEGVGTASVYATEDLYTKIEGVGKVWYKGNPSVTKDIEGLGSVSNN
ncbi:MAG TPA: head GIN domain-containing protein [Draconibacterium sp.]|nr:head GIN domain-containing protein [Draconibacterium sp.]